MRHTMKFTHIRHATIRMSLGDQVILVDPMLSAAGQLPTVGFSANALPNPLIDLPMPVEELLAGVSLVLLTHDHFDHFDDAAKRAIPTDTPIVCRAAEAARFRAVGFTAVTGLAPSESHRVGEVTVRFDNGPHGWGLMKQLMGSSASILLDAGEERVLISGDRRCDAPFRRLLTEDRPGVVFINAGAASLKLGRPITWTSEEIRQVAVAHPDTTFHIVHMDAINHCVESSRVTRARLSDLENTVVHGNA